MIRRWAQSVALWLGLLVAGSLAGSSAQGPLTTPRPPADSPPPATTPTLPLGPIYFVVAYDPATLDPQTRALIASPALAQAVHDLGAKWCLADITTEANARRPFAEIARSFGTPALVIQVGEAQSGHCLFWSFHMPLTHAEVLALGRKILP